MIPFNQFLSEGISSILYHFTSIHALEKILMTDTFELTASIGTNVERELEAGDGLYYYMSNARSRLGRYSANSPEGVFIELDGKMLATKYKGMPVDYWGRDFRKADPRSFEMEDRIYSKDPEIKDFHKYIKSISILVYPKPDYDKRPDDFERWRKIERIVENSVNMSRKYNIPVYIYDDRKAFINGNKKKQRQAPYKSYSTDKMESLADILEQGRFSFEDVEQYKAKLSDKAKDYLYDIQFDSVRDVASSISTDIHNNKKPDSPNRNEVNRIVKAMQKLKINKIEDLVIFIRKQWHNKEY